MRVGLVVYDSLETVSGGYLYDRQLVRALRRRGDSVQVISLPWRDYARHLGDNYSPRLQTELARLPVDLLLQDELNHPSLFRLNERLRGEAPYPIISIVHHLRSSETWPAWQKPFYRWVERRYLAGGQGFIFNSQTTRQAVAGLLGYDPPGVVAYPAGDRFKPQIGAAEIAQRARQPGPLRILFLGNLIPRKGLHTLLEALRRIPAGLWRLSVAGGGALDQGYARRARRLAAEPEINGQVQFLGPLDDTRLAALLETSQVLAVPSSYEGFGIVYLEGMSCGLPALATTSGAAGELITDGQDGFLVAPGDSAALAERIRRLAEQRDCLAEMSLAARRRFLAHPTWEQSMALAADYLHMFR